MSRIKYTSNDISKMSKAEIRKEYSRLRSIAHKRIKRKMEAGLSYNPEEQFFPTLSQIDDLKNLLASPSYMLAEVSKFLQNPQSTVTGARKHIAAVRKDMEEMGYGDLVDTDEKFIKFTKFMDEMREAYGDYLFDSGDALDALQQAERLQIPHEFLIEYYEEFVSNLDAIESIPTPKTRKTSTANKLMKTIAKLS